ncbi:MAG: phosphatase [Candidatus Aquiluna sp. XM-24bin5]|nr:MAG: phosphatase [Candidatus Aquiluna sp. XM-24bin5]
MYPCDYSAPVIDLHTHSTRSDGIDTPTELVEKARQAGITVLAITDHDTTSGWDEAIQAAQRVGIGLVPGIEVSTRSEIAEGRRISVHILAYLPNPENPELISELAKTRESRVNRAREMVERLSKDYEISWADIEAQIEPGATVGRPAIADALVELGIVPTRSDAFTSILHRTSPYYVSDHSLDTAEAIGLIRRAGGVSVMAHPLIDFPAGASELDLPTEHFERLIAAGLDGVEVRHRSVPDFARRWLTTLAQKHNLIQTGSSDYHGLGAKENLLGENTTDPVMLERIVDQAEGFEAPL